MTVTLAQMEAFYWVARLKGFRAAADHLNITQPTISLRIRDLERDLDTTLFDRSSYRARLTAQGAGALRDVEQVLAIAHGLGDRLRGINPLEGLLRIGAADTFAILCLPDLLSRLQRRHPALKVNVSVHHSRQLSHQVAERELDIAFLTYPEATQGITIIPLGNIELGWVAGTETPAEDRMLRPRDLEDAPILTNPPPSHLHASIRSWFTCEGCSPSRISTCDSLSIMTRLTVANFGISLLPLCILKNELEVGLLHELRVLPKLTPHTLHIAYPSESAGPGIDAVITTAQEVLSRNTMLAPL